MVVENRFRKKVGTIFQDDVYIVNNCYKCVYIITHVEIDRMQLV